VLLADDHTIVRAGLRALLGTEPDFEVVAEAGDGREAVSEAVRTQPDVVVMDLAMPALHGVEATAQIRRMCPHTAVVVLSMHGAKEFVRPAVRAGARGYLLKGSGLSDLVAAIRAVHAGGELYSPEVRALATGREADAPGGVLTPREREVLKLVAEGYASVEIAAALGLSPKTIESHRAHIMAKVGAENVVGLVRHAIRIGLVGPGD